MIAPDCYDKEYQYFPIDEPHWDSTCLIRSTDEECMDDQMPPVVLVGCAFRVPYWRAPAPHCHYEGGGVCAPSLPHIRQGGRFKTPYCVLR